MRLFHILLLPLCLLLAQGGPGAGFLANKLRKTQELTCTEKGGVCHFSPCPPRTRVEGTCYQGKAKCCL